MNWSMKRKSSRPSQTSSTRPLPRCPVTKKTFTEKKPFLKYCPKIPDPIFHFAVFVPILTKFFSVYHSKITHLMIYFFTKFNCVSIKLLKDAKNNIFPPLIQPFFSKKIAKSSSKAPKKESFEAINGCTTILQKAIYICYLLCIKERILRLVKKKENLG